MRHFSLGNDQYSLTFPFLGTSESDGKTICNDHFICGELKKILLTDGLYFPRNTHGLKTEGKHIFFLKKKKLHFARTKMFGKNNGCYTYIYIYIYVYISQVALAVKNLPPNTGDARDAGSISGWGRSPGAGNGNPLQYSCWENPMDRRAWWAPVHRVAKSWT